MHLLTGIIHQSQHNPNKIALIEGERRVSYAQLYQYIQTLSVELPVEHAAPVAICLDRGIDAAIAIFACLYAGYCYIPLDLRNPPARLQTILNDAQPSCVIGAAVRPDWLDPTDIDWIHIHQRASTRSSQPFTPPEAQSLATILYTSGSTGIPKGVALSHQALLNFAHWAQVTFELHNNDQVASLAPFCFDLSIFDLFASTLAGACIHFIPTRLTLSPSKLSQWLQQQQISIWYTVPSILHFLALKGQLVKTPLPHLSRLLFAGEVFPTPGLIALQQQLPHTRLFNLYGPTETNVCCYWPVDQEFLQLDQPIPIGQPACGAKLAIDADNQQLLVNSQSNFSGYWHQGRLANDTAPSQWLQTGDRVSLNTVGDYLYHGRMDRMLKCSGYRVEPSEIETIIHQVPGVSHCAVVGLPDFGSGQRPAAAVVLTKQGNLACVQQTLRQQLPPYMQPGRLISCDQLPCLNNGKLDYQALTHLFK